MTEDKIQQEIIMYYKNYFQQTHTLYIVVRLATLKREGCANAGYYSAALCMNS